jgi:hypothetical protein
MKRALLLGLVLTMPAACSAARVAGNTAALPFKGAWYAGKGIYKVGEASVEFADGALDMTSKTVRVTQQVVDLAGSVTEISRDVRTVDLNVELALIAARDDVRHVRVEPVRDSDAWAR